MSKIVRWLLQICLVMFFLIALLTVVYSQRDGFRPGDILVFGSITGIFGFLFWISTFIGSSEVRDEEWQKKYLSNDGLFLIWGRRILFVVAFVQVVLILMGKHG
jgi:hypothetical protein